MAAGVLGLGTAIATGLLLPTAATIAPFEALFLLAIAAVHTMATGLAASSVSMSTSTVARTTALANGTTALALADGTAALALARRDNGRKERWERGMDGRRVASSTTWRIEATASSTTGRVATATAVAGRIVALAFSRRVVTFALASASALSFPTLALAFAFSLAASKVLDEDVVATATCRLCLLHGGILSREGVELPTLDDVGTELGGVVGRHIIMMIL